MVPPATLLIVRRRDIAIMSAYRRLTGARRFDGADGCFDHRERPWRGEGRSLTDDVHDRRCVEQTIGLT